MSKVSLIILKNGSVENVIEDGKDQLLHHLMNEKWGWTSNKIGRTTGVMTGYSTRTITWTWVQEMNDGEKARWTYEWRVNEGRNNMSLSKEELTNLYMTAVDEYNKRTDDANKYEAEGKEAFAKETRAIAHYWLDLSEKIKFEIEEV